jgi:Recombination endonuclease VII
MEDPSEKKKRRRRERFKQRYADEPEFREKEKAKCRAYRQRKKAEINARRRHRYATEPEYQAARRADWKKSALLKNYGMSLEEHAARLADQGGVCVICLNAQEKSLCVDHDHKTRKLRDLLCGKCNLGLGNYNDDAALMRRGADYLDYWKRLHAKPNDTRPPPFAASGLHIPFAPSLPSIQSPPLTGEDMTPTDDTTEAGKADRLIRRAILHELRQPFDPGPSPPVDMLQAVSRAIVVKALQADMTAAGEILDRVDGKTPTAAAPETPNEVVFTWQCPWWRLVKIEHSAKRPRRSASAAVVLFEPRVSIQGRGNLFDLRRFFRFEGTATFQDACPDAPVFAKETSGWNRSSSKSSRRRWRSAR